MAWEARRPFWLICLGPGEHEMPLMGVWMVSLGYHVYCLGRRRALSWDGVAPEVSVSPNVGGPLLEGVELVLKELLALSDRVWRVCVAVSLFGKIT